MTNTLAYLAPSSVKQKKSVITFPSGLGAPGFVPIPGNYTYIPYTELI
jgi:hypothetical protein